jgi:hypothetical protein
MPSGARDVVVDSQGLVYIADTGNKRIQVYDTTVSSCEILVQVAET